MTFFGRLLRIRDHLTELLLLRIRLRVGGDRGNLPQPEGCRIAQPSFSIQGNLRMNNPYQSPQSRVADVVDGDIEAIAGGQKLVIYAILVYFLAVASQAAIGQLGLLIGLVSLGLSIAGIIKLRAGMKFSTVTQIICVVLMFVPLVGLLMLLVLNSKATKRLQAAGYRVGLLGASK